MVRSIVGKWQYVYFCDFDKPMTKYLYHELISDLEQIDIKVLGSVCDQAGENEGLKTALGVTKLKPWSTNPHDPTHQKSILLLRFCACVQEFAQPHA